MRWATRGPCGPRGLLCPGGLWLCPRLQPGWGWLQGSGSPLLVPAPVRLWLLRSAPPATPGPLPTAAEGQLRRLAAGSHQGQVSSPPGSGPQPYRAGARPRGSARPTPLTSRLQQTWPWPRWGRRLDPSLGAGLPAVPWHRVPPRRAPAPSPAPAVSKTPTCCLPTSLGLSCCPGAGPIPISHRFP